MRRALTAIFFLAGFSIASWAPHIPQVQDNLGLSEGALGVALLGLPVGALLAQPAAGWLAVRRGSRPVLLLAVLVFGFALPLPTIAGGQAGLAAALVLLGLGAGAVDVSMNVQGSSLEVRLGRPILSSLHAAYSFGALAGAANGAIAAGAGVDPTAHLVATGMLVAVLGVACASLLLPAATDTVSEGPVFSRPTGALVALGAMGAFVALVEGAALDWSAVYMQDSVGAGAGLAGVAFVAFSATWALTRLLADPIRARIGSPALLRGGGVLAAAGFGAGLALDSPAAAIAGFACLGAGIAAGFPLVIAAAGRTPGRAPGSGIAAVSTAAYAGFFAGPPLIGLLAEELGLSEALALLVPCALAVALLAPAARFADRETAPQAGAATMQA